MTIRQTRPEDADDIRRLLAAVVDEPGSFRDDAVRQGRRGFTARDDSGRVIGYLLGSFLDLAIPGEGGGSIDLLAVDASARGRGVGTALVEEWKAWLRDEGVSLAFVATTDDLGAASFYRRQGFMPCTGPWLVWSAPET